MTTTLVTVQTEDKPAQVTVIDAEDDGGFTEASTTVEPHEELHLYVAPDREIRVKEVAKKHPSL